MESELERRYPTESTSLLSLPSAHSTEGPVDIGRSVLSLSNLENYEELQLKLQDEESQKVKKPRVFFYPFEESISRRHAVMILLFACFALVSLVSLLNVNMQRKIGQESNRTSTNEFIHPRPFSHKHPVSDLGIASISRPEETSPPNRLFRRLESHDSGQRGPLPTSAWYQNLLLAHGEPTNLHRAYAIPYLVGLAGLIPGLTLHSNFLVPTDRVVQLTNNAMFGLTIGAAGGIYDKQKLENLSHQYSVSSPTELGVTLHWVRTKTLNLRGKIVLTICL